MMQKNKGSILNFAGLSIVSLLGLCSEFVIILFEEFIYEKKHYQFTITESTTHWLVISGLWGILSLVLFYVSTRVYGFDFSKKSKLPASRGKAVLLLLFLASVGLKFYVYGGWKPVIDFKQSGWFQFIFEYIYYTFQSVLILLLTTFSQEAIEKLLVKINVSYNHVPWGGIVLALTWGIIHTVTETNPVVALCFIVLSLLIGSAHLAAKKNIYISYAMTLLILLI